MRAVWTLGKLESAALTPHAVTIVTKLKDSSEDVRKAAMQTLGKLDSTTLAPHTAAIVATLLKDSDGDVRKAAVQTLGKLESAALLSPQHTKVLKHVKEEMDRAEGPGMTKSRPARPLGPVIDRLPLRHRLEGRRARERDR